jgi:hypothetical protein
MLHGPQVRAAGNQGYVFTGPRQHRAEKRPDCPCSDDREFHELVVWNSSGGVLNDADNGRLKGGTPKPDYAGY